MDIGIERIIDAALDIKVHCVADANTGEPAQGSFGCAVAERRQRVLHVLRQYLSIGGELQGIGDIFGTKVLQFHCGWNGFRQLAQRQAVRGGEAQLLDGQVVTVYFFNLDILQIESWQVEGLYGKGIVVVFFHFKDKAIGYITALREFFFGNPKGVELKRIVFGFAHLDSIAASLLYHPYIDACLIGVGESVEAFLNVKTGRYQGNMILLGRPFALA